MSVYRTIGPLVFILDLVGNPEDWFSCVMAHINVEPLILFVEVKTRARKTGKKKKKETESAESNDCKNEVSSFL